MPSICVLQQGWVAVQANPSCSLVLFILFNVAPCFDEETEGGLALLLPAFVFLINHPTPAAVTTISRKSQRCSRDKSCLAAQVVLTSWALDTWQVSLPNPNFLSTCSLKFSVCF